MTRQHVGGPEGICLRVVISGWGTATPETPRPHPEGVASIVQQEGHAHWFMARFIVFRVERNGRSIRPRGTEEK